MGKNKNKNSKSKSLCEDVKSNSWRFRDTLEVQKKEKATAFYKKRHNIGNRKANILVNSYKESDVAVLFDESYFSNFRCSMSFAKASREKREDNLPEDTLSESSESDCPPSCSTSIAKKVSTKKSSTSKPKSNKNPTPTPRGRVVKKKSESKRERTISESPPRKRAKRTASLNAGAILSAMLEKTSSSNKKSSANVASSSLDMILTTNQSTPRLSDTGERVSQDGPLKKTKKGKNAKSQLSSPEKKSILVDVSCSPINIDEMNKEAAASKFQSIRSGNHRSVAGLSVPQNAPKLVHGSKPSGNNLRKSRKNLFKLSEARTSANSLETSRIQKNLPTSDSLFVSSTRSSNKGVTNVANLKKPTGSPTLSTSSSATIINTDVLKTKDVKKPKVKESKKLLIRNVDVKVKKKGIKAKKVEGNCAEISTGNLLNKTSRRLASLNAQAVLAACLEAPKRFPKPKKDVKPAAREKVVPPLPEVPDVICVDDYVPASANVGKKSKLDKIKKSLLQRDRLSIGKSSPLLPANLGVSSGSDKSRSQVVSVANSSADVEIVAHKTDQSSAVTGVHESAHSLAHFSNNRSLTPSRAAATDEFSHSKAGPSQESPVRRQSSGNLQPNRRQFSTKKATSSAVVATILPHNSSRIGISRQSSGFQGQPSNHDFSGGGNKNVIISHSNPVHMNSLLVPKRHFPVQYPNAPASGLNQTSYGHDARYSYLGVLGNVEGRQGAHASFHPQQQLNHQPLLPVSPYNLSSPMTTVVFNPSQQQINLQLCSPTAYGQLCRQFCPPSSSFFHTVPFSPDRFQLYQMPSSAPLSFPPSNPSSHFFVPYGGTAATGLGQTAASLNFSSPQPGTSQPSPNGSKAGKTSFQPYPSCHSGGVGGASPSWMSRGKAPRNRHTDTASVFTTSVVSFPGQSGGPITSLTSSRQLFQVSDSQSNYVKISPKKLQQDKKHRPITSVSHTVSSPAAVSVSQQDRLKPETKGVVLNFPTETVSVRVSTSPASGFPEDPRLSSTRCSVATSSFGQSSQLKVKAKKRSKLDDASEIKNHNCGEGHIGVSTVKKPCRLTLPAAKHSSSSVLSIPNQPTVMTILSSKKKDKKFTKSSSNPHMSNRLDDIATVNHRSGDDLASHVITFKTVKPLKLSNQSGKEETFGAGGIDSNLQIGDVERTKIFSPDDPTLNCSVVVDTARVVPNFNGTGGAAAAAAASTTIQKIRAMKSTKKVVRAKDAKKGDGKSPRKILGEKKTASISAAFFKKARSPKRGFVKGSRHGNACGRKQGHGQRHGSKGKFVSERLEKNDLKRDGLDGNSGNKRQSVANSNSGIPLKRVVGVNSLIVGSEENRVSGWTWLGDPAPKVVSVETDGAHIKRLCYPAICHSTGDVVRVKDCVLVRSGMKKKDIPYIAKVYGLWEEGETREMMMGVFWYYRREHIDSESVASRYLDDEVFASRHRDVIPVACIEDRCHVLPFNQYCRYRAEVSRLESGAGRSLSSLVVPPLLPFAVDPSVQAMSFRSLPVAGSPPASSSHRAVCHGSTPVPLATDASFDDGSKATTVDTCATSASSSIGMMDVTASMMVHSSSLSSLTSDDAAAAAGSTGPSLSSSPSSSCLVIVTDDESLIGMKLAEETSSKLIGGVVRLQSEILEGNLNIEPSSSSSPVSTFAVEAIAKSDSTTIIDNLKMDVTATIEATASDATATIEPITSYTTVTIEATLLDVTATIEATTSDATSIIEATTSDATATIEETISDATATIEATISDVSATIEATTSDATATIEATTSDATATIETTISDVSATIEATTLDATATIEATTSDATATIEATTSDTTATIEATASNSAAKIEATTSDSTTTTTEATLSDSAAAIEATRLDSIEATKSESTESTTTSELLTVAEAASDDGNVESLIACSVASFGNVKSLHSLCSSVLDSSSSLPAPPPPPPSSLPTPQSSSSSSLMPQSVSVPFVQSNEMLSRSSRYEISGYFLHPEVALPASLFDIPSSLSPSFPAVSVESQSSHSSTSLVMPFSSSYSNTITLLPSPYSNATIPLSSSYSNTTIPLSSSYSNTTTVFSTSTVSSSVTAPSTTSFPAVEVSNDDATAVPSLASLALGALSPSSSSLSLLPPASSMSSLLTSSEAASVLKPLSSTSPSIFPAYLAAASLASPPLAGISSASSDAARPSQLSSSSIMLQQISSLPVNHHVPPFTAVSTLSILPASLSINSSSSLPPLPCTGLTERLAKEVDRDNVFLCRHIYDIKLRRISKNPHIPIPSVAQGPVLTPAQPVSGGGGGGGGGGGAGSLRAVVVTTVV